MTRINRIFRNIAIGFGAFVLLVAVSTLVVIRTDWFRDYVRQKIIAAVNEGVGGRTEMGSFSFDLSKLHAIVEKLVIHGTEPPEAKPFVHAERIEVRLRLFTSIKHLLDVAYLGVDRPEVNVMVFSDGRTNVPTPKAKTQSDKTPLESIVELAVDRFDLTNGSLIFDSHKQPLNVHAENLRAQLFFNVLSQAYSGQLSLEPIYIVSGKQNPVRVALVLPLSLDRKQIELKDAKVNSGASQLLLNASIADLRNLKISARMEGDVAMEDVTRLANVQNAGSRQVKASSIHISGSGLFSQDVIEFAGLKLQLGSSVLEASGKLKDKDRPGSLQFSGDLALAELGQLANLPQRPSGSLDVKGTATMDEGNHYQIDGTVNGRGIAFSSGTQRFQGINLDSSVHLDEHRLDLSGLRLAAFGGEFAGDARLEDFDRYSLKGQLRHFDLQTAARLFGQQDLPYAGNAGGPVDAAGSLKGNAAQNIVAHARLAIAPGRRGIPVSGKLNADYTGKDENLSIRESYVVLPHSRAEFSGSLGNTLNISLVSSDASDLLAAIPPAKRPAVHWNGGEATFTGQLTGKLQSPQVTGHLSATRLNIQERQFDSLAVDVAASSNHATISRGTLIRGPMQAQVSGSMGLRQWKPTEDQSLNLDATLSNGDMADLLALAGQPSKGYSGSLQVTAHVTGTIGNPLGSAEVQALNGTLYGESFDGIQAHLQMVDQQIRLSSASMTAGPSRVDLTSEFQHPRNRFTTGKFHAHVRGEGIDLSRIKTLQSSLPRSAGELRLDADMNVDVRQLNAEGVEESEVLLSSVTADASLKNMAVEGRLYGNVDATAHTSGQTVNYKLNSDFAGSKTVINGKTQLLPEYPTSADFSISNLSVESVLTLAKRTDIPVKGNLSATGQLNGPIKDPQGQVDIDLRNAAIEDEPIDRVRARVEYLPGSVNVPRLEMAAGASHLNLTARYEHPRNNLQQGRLQLAVADGRVDLARIRTLQDRRPGLGGIAQIDFNGVASIQEAEPRVLLKDLNANIRATGITVQKNNVGDVVLTAKTTGDHLTFALDSNIAKSSIHAQGTARLTSGYPVQAQMIFRDVLWSRLEPLVMKRSTSFSSFDVAVEGQADLNGPVMDTSALRASLQLSKLQLTAVPKAPANQRAVRIENQGPIAAKLDAGIARIESLHLVGPKTDIQAAGTIPVFTGTYNLTANVTADLGTLHQFDRDFVSSGAVNGNATVRGTLQQPLVNGRLELRNASVNYATLPNGISNANGVVTFTGTSASIRNMTAETGGGKLTLNGFATFRDTVRFGLRVNASTVRIRPQQGVSIVADANLNLTGTEDASIASGAVTIQRVTYAPQSDFGSILLRAGPPADSDDIPSPILNNMKLDIEMRTASLSVQAAQAQNVQADADLRVRGTAARPGVLGRITISEGKLVFFGSTYNVNSGTISFFNPMRIEPILNLSLDTHAKGVDVVLNVTGPVNNMKLSYTSDPPLQFSEIVSLLASGKTPTSDPTILANQPSQPPQSFEQMGETQLLSKAVADPVSTRLQRVFGVSQLKIDPSFSGGSDLPQARLTLQQQVTSHLVLTYVTALDDPNSQIIRAEWIVNSQWSAIASRDQNGTVSINFFYKRQFR